ATRSSWRRAVTSSSSTVSATGSGSRSPTTRPPSSALTAAAPTSRSAPRPSSPTSSGTSSPRAWLDDRECPRGHSGPGGVDTLPRHFRRAGSPHPVSRRLFTSESVTEGHPDKIADQISDSVLDALLKEDPGSRVAVETLVTTGLVHVAGEVTTEGWADIPT